MFEDLDVSRESRSTVCDVLKKFKRLPDEKLEQFLLDIRTQERVLKHCLENDDIAPLAVLLLVHYRGVGVKLTRERCPKR
jgi:hypothetical protein